MRLGLKRVSRAVVLALGISLIQTTPIAITAASAAEVSTSTLGYSFAIANPPGYSGWVWTLYLSSSETGTASVDFPTGTDTATVTIRPGITSAVPVPSQDYLAGDASGLIRNKVTRITSNVPIAVYGCSRQSATSDCTNFIPITSWGNRYRPLSYPTTIDGLGDRVTVLTGNDTATITMRFKTAVTTNSGTFSAGSETSTVLTPNTVWTLEAISKTQGFTGSLITSTAPIGVIAGADCINGFGGACDTNVEMVPPESSWGKNFYLNNYKNASKTGSGVRILASQDTTTVTISGDVSRSVTLNAGDVFSELLFASSSDDLNLSVTVVASKPVLLGHYMISGSYTSLGGTDIGDPSLSYMPPFEQFLSEYTVVSAGGFKAQFINVIIPTAAISTLRLDGASVSSSLFRQIGSTTWSSAQIDTSTGSHNLIASQPFGIEIYGADNADSYAYVGGANYSALSTVASLRLNASSTTGTVGQEVCIPVTVLDASDAPVLGVRVDGTTSGTNSGLFPSATTNSSGVANICYVGALAGTDTLTFSANGFTTTVTIVWSLAIPAISYSPSTLSLATSVAMPTLTPTNTGGTIASWAIAPSLPTGLSLNTSTGVISGTPSSDTASSSYTVTATNAAGSGTTTLTIAVIPAVQPTISYSPSTRNFTLDSTITSMTPTTTGTFPSWSVSPTLPRGLSLNAQSGVIAGTPTRTTTAATYRVTATNTAGSSFTDLTLAVVESIPNISFNVTNFSFVKNSAISIISPLNTGSPATSWTISPALSAGLSFSSLTGQISGTPSASVSVTTYTVTGTNTAGSASATVQIAVVDNLLAPSIIYATSSASLTVGTAMSTISPTNSGGAVASYSVSPSVSNGINFSTSTGIFSGTLTASLASTVYTVTATNATGTSTATVTLSSGTVSSLSTTSGLVPAFSSVITATNGFTVTVTNYSASYTWSVTVTTPATVILSSSGLITVTGLTGQGTQATVTVTTSRSGYTTQSASITGSTNPPPPPPNYLYTLTPPNLSKVSTTYVCRTGTYEFVRAAVTKEIPNISFFIYTLIVNGARVSQISTNGTTGSPYVGSSAMIYTATASKTQAIFELGARTDILPAQCEVLAYQENAVGMGNSNILAKAIPNVSWPALLPITATSKIGSTQLNATADVEGTFTYSVAAGSTLEVGKYTLTVTFTPKDTDNYDVVVVKNQLRVLTASTSIRISITIQAPQQTIAIRTSGGILKADPEMLLGGKATAGSSGFGIEKISISGSSVTVWPMPGFSGKTSLGLIQSGAGGIINIVQPLIVVPTGVSLVNVNVLDFAKPTLTWSAVQGAASYLVSANGERVCSTAVNTCIGQIALGPKSIVSVTVTGKDLVKTTTQPKIVVKADVEAASVNFDSGEFVLTADARAELLRFARAIRPLGYTKLTVTGHTGTGTGGQGVDNNKLSQDRATAVLGVLQKLLPGYSISIKGQADSEPVASNNNEVGKAKNRRVEIRVVQG